MKMLIALALVLSANVFAATTTATTTETPTTAGTADGKVHFEIFTPDDNGVAVGQALQLLNLEKARPDLYTVTARYVASDKMKFAPNTFWKTAFVAKYNRPQLAEWLQCVYFDPETHTCGTLLNIDFKNLKSKEKDLRNDFAENLNLSKASKNLKDTIFINGNRYEGPLAYGQLLNVVNGLLPKEKQLAGLGKYEVTKLYVIGNTKGLGARDMGLEREFTRWIPNLQVQALTPDSTLGNKLLTATESPGIPAYVFDKDSHANVAVQKLAVAGKVKIKPSNYGIFEMKSGVTEMKTGTKEIPNQLDLWVMSQCPFGVKAETAILNARAQNAIPETVKINVRYIVSAGRDGKDKKWQSLHGDPELQEDIRQVAIQQAWPDKFWKYLEVRNADLKNEDWKASATAAGLDPYAVEAKLELGRKLIAQDIKDGLTLKVNGSPTYMWQNRFVLKTDDEMKASMGFNPNEFKTLATATPAGKRGAASEKQQAVAPADGKCGS
jgi:hypothetical protein